MTEHRTFCRICEPMCALTATVDNGIVLGLKPDHDDPHGQGFACHKGLGFHRVNNDPDRLSVPLRRGAKGLEPTDWDTALDTIATALNRLRGTHGPDAVAIYNSNPFAFNSVAMLVSGAFAAAFGTHSIFSAGTQDTSNKFAANAEMFGSNQLLIPDLAHTDHFLCLGANPRVSHWTAIATSRPLVMLRDLKDRGVPVRMINPRHTETARWLGCETDRVRPDSDAWLLAAMIATIFEEDLADRDAIERWGCRADELRAFVAAYPAERVADIVGLPADRIRLLASEFAAAPSACAYMATGVNQGSQGTLAYWLLTMLALVTGNLGRRGGLIHVPGPVDTCAPLPPISETRRASAAGDVLTPMGWLPANLLADMIEGTDSPLRALIVLGGNPLLSTGGGARLAKALARLDLLVVVDLFRSTIADLADVVLPATTWLERPDFNLISLGIQPDPFLRHADAVVAPRDEARNEAWMLAEIGKRLALPGFECGGESIEESVLQGFFGASGYDLDMLRASSATTIPGTLPQDIDAATRRAVLRSEGMVDCFPAAFAPAIARFEETLAEGRDDAPDTLRMISRRNDRSHNNNQFWRIKAIGPDANEAGQVFVSVETASALDLPDGCAVRVVSTSGEVAAVLRIDAELRPGVIAIGHASPMSAASGDVDHLLPMANTLTPGGHGSFDPLSNMAHFSGIRVRIEPINRES